MFLKYSLITIFAIIFPANLMAGVVVLGNSANNDTKFNIPLQTVVQNVKSRISRSGLFVHENPTIRGVFSSIPGEAQALTREQKKELLEIDQSMTIVIVKINADFSSNSKKEIRYKLMGDIFSLSDSSFISSWSLPFLSVSLPPKCDRRCQDAEINKKLIDGSIMLGDSLAKLIHGNSASSIITPGATSIRFDILDLSESETIQLLDLMKNEFPGFIDVSQMETYGLRKKFNYRTTSQISKVYEWIQISLMEIGLNIEQDVEIILNGEDIFIKKYFSHSKKSRPSPNISRFN